VDIGPAGSLEGMRLRERGGGTSAGSLAFWGKEKKKGNGGQRYTFYDRGMKEGNTRKQLHSPAKST